MWLTVIRRRRRRWRREDQRRDAAPNSNLGQLATHQRERTNRDFTISTFSGHKLRMALLGCVVIFHFSNHFLSLPSVRDLILSRPGSLSSRSLAELWWLILGARQMLSVEERPEAPEAEDPSLTMYSPPRKCGREKVMEPMPITRTPETDAMR